MSIENRYIKICIFEIGLIKIGLFEICIGNMSSCNMFI